MPVAGPMVDTFGRTVRDLRVSVTDRCNLRCTYCMPAEGLDWLDRDEVLTADELARVISIAVTRLGVESVRFTGGEPLLRADLADIIAATAALEPRPEIAITTNGLALRRRVDALADAGLDRVNVSLDTVDRDHFAALTRRDRLDDVLDGLAAARDAGLAPIKVNAVATAPHGLDDLPDLAQFCLDEGYQLRVIEQMPLDAQHSWSRERMFTAAEVLARLQESLALLPDDNERGSAPAQTWIVDGYRDHTGAPARIGVIGSVSSSFCGACDRTRLTADGALRNCLFASQETDLRSAFRSGADDEDIARLWRVNTWGKRPGHAIDDPGFLQPSRPMSAIGG